MRYYPSAVLATALLFLPVGLYAGEEDHHGHDHGKEESHSEKEHGHGVNAKTPGTGRTSVVEIITALRENLACMEKEIAEKNHEAFHGCLETIGRLGQDLIALKTPVDPIRKKRVNGFAKNLGMIAHKTDEYKDAGQMDKAKAQLEKLKKQIELIEKQFPEFSKNAAERK